MSKQSNVFSRKLHFKISPKRNSPWAIETAWIPPPPWRAFLEYEPWPFLTKKSLGEELHLPWTNPPLSQWNNLLAQILYLKEYPNNKTHRMCYHAHQILEFIGRMRRTACSMRVRPKDTHHATQWIKPPRMSHSSSKNVYAVLCGAVDRLICWRAHFHQTRLGRRTLNQETKSFCEVSRHVFWGKKVVLL